MKLLVGLGNPDEKYNMTRHNAGFMVMDEIANLCSVQINQKKFKSLIAITKIRNEKVLLMKPQTYMNLSGEAIIAAMNYYGLEPSDICVIYDDVDTECGRIRLREKGSAGGHNGMKSIIGYLGTNEFCRIRIGIDSIDGREKKNYVLGHFNKEQVPLIEDAVKRAASAAIDFVNLNFQNVMNAYNRKKDEKNN
jgi:peptidyl-tRNA hydrolase